MNVAVKNTIIPENIFSVNEDNFESVSLQVFRFQYEHNAVYRQYCDTLKIAPSEVCNITGIPFLPIAFFKTHLVTTTQFIPETIFESSGTTHTINSRHFIKDLTLYEESFAKAFRLFYGEPSDWCIIALLPSYLERQNASLVVMADKLIQQSGHASSGFYLDDLDRLRGTLQDLERMHQKTLLIGVTFALLDLVEAFPMPLEHTVIMETGGMKGRRAEITRQEVHNILRKSFELKEIHSEYGMTELLSQAYSPGEGRFSCPPWMKILIRAEDDPLEVEGPAEQGTRNGAVNIIDLANIYSCSFIATEDAGRLYEDGSFEILGRLDNTDIRGCSLMAL